MNRLTESRLSKLEGERSPARLAHEDWLPLLDAEPARSTAVFDAEITATAITEHGSFSAAATAARTQATRSRDPLDDLYAADLECRAAGIIGRGNH